MLRRISRRFTRLYNAVKQRPRSSQKRDPSVYHRFRESSKIKSTMSMVISSAKEQVQVKPLSSTLQKTSKEIKATEQVLSFRSPTDESFEPKLRQHMVIKGISKTGESHTKYLQENLFILDQSVESRKNVALSGELEKYTNSLLEFKEKQRRKALQEQDIRVLLGDKSTKDTSVDQLLSHISSIAAIEHDQETSEVDSLVEASSGALVPGKDLSEVTGELISYKGVVDLTGRTTGHLNFSHLSYRELANYICHNTRTQEEGLQLFVGSRESDQFDVNLRASLVQKLAVVSTSSAAHILNDKRFKDLLGDVHRDVSALSNKNVADTFWAVCRMHREERTLSPLVGHLVHSLCDVACQRMPTLNSMNLAYLCQGMLMLKLHLPTVAENVISRLVDLLELSEKTAGELIEKKLDPWNYSINVQPSLFYGFEDHTLPKFPLTAQSIDMLAHYLSVYPYYDSPSLKFGLLTRIAKFLTRSLLNELNTRTIVSLFKCFGRDQALALKDEVRDMFRELALIMFPDTFSLSIPEVTVVTKAMLNSGLYSANEFFKELEIRALALIGSVSGNELIGILNIWARYYIAIEFGVDPFVDPGFMLLPRKQILGPVITEFLRLIDTFTLSETEQLEVAKVLALLGYPFDFHPALHGIHRLAQQSEYQPALFLLQAMQGGSGFIDKVVTQLPKVLSTGDINSQVKILLALAHVNANIEMNDVCTALVSELEKFTVNKNLVAIAWAVCALGGLQTKALQQIISKVNFAQLTKTEVIMMYQVHLTIKDLSLELIPKDIIERGSKYMKDLVIFDGFEASETHVLEADRKVGGYYVQFYSQSEKTCYEKYRKDCRLRDGNLIGLLSLRERHLNKAGVSIHIKT